MQKFKQFPPRTLRFRSLLILTGALLLMATLVPRANAQAGRFTVVYFNFEDSAVGNVDFTADVVPPLGDNPGGGIENSTLVPGGANGIAFTNAPGLTLNRTALDIDTGPPQLGLNLNHTSAHEGATLSFNAQTTSFSSLSLSFAINNQGNGYATVQLSYIIGGVTTVVGSQQTGTTPTIITFTLPAGANNQTAITFVLTFTAGQSNGNNLQTVIDNIQLTAAPEPATVVGGLLGVLGLCWFQRRRLIGSVRFRST